MQYNRPISISISISIYQALTNPHRSKRSRTSGDMMSATGSGIASEVPLDHVYKRQTHNDADRQNAIVHWMIAKRLPWTVFEGPEFQHVLDTNALMQKPPHRHRYVALLWVLVTQSRDGALLGKQIGWTHSESRCISS